MKRLYLTAVLTVPSEEGQKRIDEALEKQNSIISQETVYRDEDGKSREDWEDILSGKVPPGFADAEKEFYNNNTQISEIDENGYMQLDIEEIDYLFLDYLLPINQIVDIIDNQEFGSMITLKDSATIHVKEPVEVINYLIELSYMNSFQKFRVYIYTLFNKLKSIINK